MQIRSKLDYWCESILEAGWLAALVLAPLFFNVFSSRVFEPDKISLVRSIALVMLAAWLTKITAGGAAWLPAFQTSAQNGSNLDASQSSWRDFVKVPFFVSVLLLIAAYLISTATSVAPFVSWFGSYQRLQGTYSFLSYVTIAGLAAAHLRRPEQLRRLQHTVILTSFPISVYGVIQHNLLDPLPWGGDVTVRVAANAGNAIFLAAYLIMAAFLALERIYASFAAILSSDANENNRGSDIATALAGSVYIVIFIVQLLAIFWSQSRGPQIGLIFGLYLFVLLVVSARRPPYYRLLAGILAVGGIAGFLLVIAINTLPQFSALRAIPYVGRIGNLMDTEGTGKVRILIWKGASGMMLPHQALTYPDGEKDAFNPIRPLIGYGPEAMWVAYNPFYPPDLANIEARNASPDRSHNETWDSLVITGGLGFVAELSLFIGIFYWTLKWLGLIVNRRDKTLFFVLITIGFVAWMTALYTFDDQQVRFFGVALPVGIISGLIVYVNIAAFMHSDYRPTAQDAPRLLMIIALFCAIIAHYAEIHFGIAIAATRTHFWIFTATLLTLGMRWLQPDAVTLLRTQELPASEFSVANEAPAPAPSPSASKNRSERPRSTTNRPTTNRPAPARSNSMSNTFGLPLLPSTVMTDLLVFFTAVFIYTTNPQQLNSAAQILVDSVTKLFKAGQMQSSAALLFLLLFTWLFAATLGLAGEVIAKRRSPTVGWWLTGYGLHAVVVWMGWLIYGLIQAGRVAPIVVPQSIINNPVEQVNYKLNFVADHFARFTWLVIIWMAVTAIVYAWPWLQERRLTPAVRPAVAIVAAPFLAIFAFFLLSTVNIALVRADIIYKQGQQSDGAGQWIDSIELYKRALDVRKSEDQYMLFLGRSYLELAKTVPNMEGAYKFPENATIDTVLDLLPNQVQQMGRLDLLRAAATVLVDAQTVNPLNTDHTANLSRLYRTWADLVTDNPTMRQEMLDKSLAMYEKAVTLSPNAAHLWNERGNAYQGLGNNEKALEMYQHSLAIDPLFEQTYLILADFYDRTQQYDPLIETMQKGIEANKAAGRPDSSSLNYYNYIGLAEARSNRASEAITSYLKVLEIQPTNAAAMRNLALLYQNQGDLVEAGKYAEQALLLVGPNGGDVYTELLNTGVGIYQQLSAKEPTSYTPILKMGQFMQQLGQLDVARQLAQQALQLAPEADKPNVQQFVQAVGG